MQSDEQAIRALVAAWHQATAAEDLPAILKLMAEDVVFLVAGQPPMRGREAFATNFQTAIQHFRIESNSQIEEVFVAGELGYFWSHLVVTMTPRQGGAPQRRTGHTLTVLRKESDDTWVLARDANLLVANPSSAA